VFARKARGVWHNRCSVSCLLYGLLLLVEAAWIGQCVLGWGGCSFVGEYTASTRPLAPTSFTFSHPQTVKFGRTGKAPGLGRGGAMHQGLVKVQYNQLLVGRCWAGLWVRAEHSSHCSPLKHAGVHSPWASPSIIRSTPSFKPHPLCDIPSGCCSFTGPWTVTRSSLRMLRPVAAFCRPLRPVLLLVSFPQPSSWCAGAVPNVAWCAVCACAPVTGQPRSTHHPSTSETLSL
jgi:hypothetical protein